MNSAAAILSPKTRILMVDDHPIVREGMAQFLNLQDDLDLCCQASDSEEALAAMTTHRPDMVIVDMTLQGASGLDLVKVLRNRFPALPILAMSMHDETLFAERALRAGANGYLMKLEPTDQILAAIRQVRAGNIYLSAAMHGEITRRLMTAQNRPATPLASLTEREFEVLHLIGLGFGTRQIAERLNRSIKTVEAHRANLKEKLHLPSGQDLVRFAVQWFDGR